MKGRTGELDVVGMQRNDYKAIDSNLIERVGEAETR